MSRYVIDLEDDHARKLVDHLRRTLGPIDRRLATQIESQIPPARPDEPLEFGSIVLARREGRGRRGMYVRTYAVEVDRPWTTGNYQSSWSELEDIEIICRGLDRSTIEGLES